MGFIIAGADSGCAGAGAGEAFVCVGSVAGGFTGAAGVGVSFFGLAGRFTTMGRSLGNSATGAGCWLEGAGACAAGGGVGVTGLALSLFFVGVEASAGVVVAGATGLAGGVFDEAPVPPPSPGITCPGLGFCACFFTSITGSFTGGLFVPGDDPVAGCTGVPGSALGSSADNPACVSEADARERFKPTPAHTSSDMTETMPRVRAKRPGTCVEKPM